MRNASSTQCPRRTPLYAFAADRTAVPVNGVNPVPQNVPAADCRAPAAENTFRSEECQFRLAADRFRIVTPDAAKRAPLEKKRRPDAGPVVDGKRLDIGKESFWFHSYAPISFASA